MNEGLPRGEATATARARRVGQGAIALQLRIFLKNVARRHGGTAT